jgi:preprotein translocase subunit SecG
MIVKTLMVVLLLVGIVLTSRSHPSDHGSTDRASLLVYWTVESALLGRYAMAA